jgi:type III secretory pathway component EscT
MVPQADLFSLGLPIKIMAGSLLLLLYMSQFFPLIPSMLDTMVRSCDSWKASSEQSRRDQATIPTHLQRPASAS